MKVTLVVLLQLLVVSQAIRFQFLDSLENYSFSFNDELYSPLGHRRAKLQKLPCSIVVEQFDPATAKYVEAGTFTPRTDQLQCTKLTITNRQILTSAGKVFMEIISQNTHTITRLTIDDSGALNLLSFTPEDSNNPIPTWDELRITDFVKSSPNMLILTSSSKFSAISLSYTNTNNWRFTLKANNLDIQKGPITYQFPLQELQLTPTGVFNSHGDTLPYLRTLNMPFEPPCRPLNQPFGIISPFTIVADQKLPLVKLIDGKGYTVFQFTPIKDNYCPKGLFQLNGDCIVTCPAPYLASMRPHSLRCVLSCQYGANVDTDSMFCTCPTDLEPRYYSSTYGFFCQKPALTYPMGCYCPPGKGNYDRSLTLSCVNFCPDGSTPAAGVCVQCPKNCGFCEKDPTGLYFVKCIKCNKGFLQAGPLCIPNLEGCGNNCISCINKVCLACEPFYSLSKEVCVSACPSGTSLAQAAPLEYKCEVAKAIRPCPQGCIMCLAETLCLVCEPGTFMFVTGLLVSCRSSNPFLDCSSSLYSYYHQKAICVVNDLISSGLTKCRLTVPNCLICFPQTQTTINKCLICKEGFYLTTVDPIRCVGSCPGDTFQFKGRCLKSIPNCAQNGFRYISKRASLELDTVVSSDPYHFHTHYSMEPANNPGGYSLYASAYHILSNYSGLKLETTLRVSQKICMACEEGYGFISDKLGCKKCPSNCTHCFFAQENSCTKGNSAYEPPPKVSQICQSQQYLFKNGTCLTRCPDGTTPVLSASYFGKIECADLSQASQSSLPTPLSLIMSIYPNGNGKNTLYLMFSKKIKKIVQQRLLSEVTLQKLSSGQGTILSLSSLNLMSDERTMKLEDVQQGLTVIHFLSPHEVQGIDNSFLASSTFGTNSSQSTPNLMNGSFFWIGMITSLVLFILQCIYVGSNVVYKMDNLIIFAQSLYFFTFAKDLYGNHLVGFYNGWSVLSGLFFPNFFKDALGVDYVQLGSPSSFRVTVQDPSFIKHAGNSISIFITFAVIWVAAGVASYLLSKRGRPDIWKHDIAANSMCAFVEFFSLNILFWACACINYSLPTDSSADRAGAGVLITIIAIYSLVKGYYNYISLMYMIKRFIIAAVFAGLPTMPGLIWLLVLNQVIFIAIRFFSEDESRQETMFERVYITLEGVLMFVTYLVCAYIQITQVVGVVSCLAIFILIAGLITEVADLYFASIKTAERFQADSTSTNTHIPSTERNLTPLRNSSDEKSPRTFNQLFVSDKQIDIIADDK